MSTRASRSASTTRAGRPSGATGSACARCWRRSTACSRSCATRATARRRCCGGRWRPGAASAEDKRTLDTQLTLTAPRPGRILVHMRLARAVVATVALMLLGAGSASAASTWYVDDGGSGTACTEAAPCKTVATAIGKASDGDTIHIGAGTYAESNATAKRLTLDGNGLGHLPFFLDRTTLRATTAGPALELTGGGTVRDMVVTGTDTNMIGESEDALLFDPSTSGPTLTYMITNVSARAAAGISGQPGAALEVFSSTRAVDVQADHSFFAGRAGNGFAVRFSVSGGAHTLDDVTIDGNGTGAGLVLLGGSLKMAGGAVTDVTGEGAAIVSGAASLDRVRVTGGSTGAEL